MGSILAMVVLLAGGEDPRHQAVFAAFVDGNCERAKALCAELDFADNDAAIALCLQQYDFCGAQGQVWDPIVKANPGIAEAKERLDRIDLERIRLGARIAVAGYCKDSVCIIEHGAGSRDDKELRIQVQQRFEELDARKATAFGAEYGKDLCGFVRPVVEWVYVQTRTGGRLHDVVGPQSAWLLDKAPLAFAVSVTDVAMYLGQPVVPHAHCAFEVAGRTFRGTATSEQRPDFRIFVSMNDAKDPVLVFGLTWCKPQGANTGCVLMDGRPAIRAWFDRGSEPRLNELRRGSLMDKSYWVAPPTRTGEVLWRRDTPLPR